MQTARSRTQGIGRPLKSQQSGTSERRILSDITNSNKHLSSFGTPRPSPKQPPAGNERRILSDISNAKPLPAFGTPRPSPKPGLALRGDIKADYGFLSENFPQPPQKPVTAGAGRAPLRDIVNESQIARATRESGLGGVKQSQKPKKKAGPVKFQLTAEQIRQAEEWAREDVDIERTYFTGEDMDALREKIVEAEIEETVAMVRNYRGVRFPLDKPKMDELEPIYFEDGRLKPDPRSASLEEDLEYPLKAMDFEAGISLEEDPVLTLTNISEDSKTVYPPIPENWHFVLDECAPASA